LRQDRRHFRDALKNYRRIVQKAEIAIVSMRGFHIPHMPDKEIALLPDCGQLSSESQ